MSPEGRRGSRRVFLDATGMYLRAVLELEEEIGLPPARSWLRARLDISRSAVNQQLRDLTEAGLVTLSTDHRVVLTPAGRARAQRVMRKHRLAERLLVDVIGLDWYLAHAEATRWQHVLGDEVERRLLEILDRPWSSPYGNPVPALDELLGGPAGTSPERPPDPEVVRCDHFARAGGGPAVVHLICEDVQTDEDLLRRLAEAGVRPGELVRVERTETGVRVVGAGDAGVGLDDATARSILVVAARPAAALAAPNPYPCPGSRD